MIGDFQHWRLSARAGKAAAQENDEEQEVIG
jgi:hypothetical protein